MLFDSKNASLPISWLLPREGEIVLADRSKFENAHAVTFSSQDQIDKSLPKYITVTP
jgi:hypothetical protein